MKRLNVKSSNIKSIGFENGILEVEFKQGVYQYAPITHDQYISLLGSESKSKWINDNVKKNPDIKYKKV